MLDLGVDDAIVHAANRRDDVELDVVGRRCASAARSTERL